MDIRERLLKGESRVCFWGLGYIGFSAMVYYAHKGVKVIGYDVNSQVAEAVSEGRGAPSTLDRWLRMNGMRPDLRLDAVSSVDKLATLSDIEVFKLAIPTEQNGVISDSILATTCSQLAGLLRARDNTRKVLVDIESTVAPSMIDRVVIPAFSDMPHVLISSSPRRDWFISSEKDLASIPRIVGGVTPEATEWAVAVNSIVCRDVVRASAAKEAAATKALENAIRNIGISVVNQMARETGLDVREVCRLASTKWNVPRFDPSIGIGGYCIPLGPSYLMDGVEAGLSLLKAATDETGHHIDWVADKLGQSSYTRFAVLGLAYRGDVPVYKASPAVMIAQRLYDKYEKNLSVSDALATPGDYAWMFADRHVPVHADPLEALQGAEVVIIGSFHGVYGALPLNQLMSALSSCKIVLDNEGAFAHVPASMWDAAGISYRRPGQHGWASF